MPVLVVLLLIIFLIFAALIWVTFGLLPFIFILIVAGIIGAIADAIVPGHVEFGWLGSIVAGLVGSWLGTLIFGRIGPVIVGIPIVSAFLGALILAFVVAFLFKGTAGRRV